MLNHLYCFHDRTVDNVMYESLARGIGVLLFILPTAALMQSITILIRIKMDGTIFYCCCRVYNLKCF